MLVDRLLLRHEVSPMPLIKCTNITGHVPKGCITVSNVHQNSCWYKLRETLQMRSDLLQADRRVVGNKASITQALPFATATV